MKAIALDEYGDAGVLTLRELPEPALAPDVIRVRVKAAGVNPIDTVVRAGHLQGLYPHHTPLIPGWDVAGVVEEVGAAVSRFVPGDEVISYARKDSIQHGTYAEQVGVAEVVVAQKPRSLTFAQAGALPLAGLTAWQLLADLDVGPGDVVLVHAAAGGVGHLAVQLARARGAARVLGTASPGNHEFLRDLGCEPVAYGDDLPKRIHDLVGGDGRVDAVLDLIGGEALKQSAVLVRHHVRHGSVVDPNVKGQGGRYVFVRPDASQLTLLGALAEAGRLHVEVAKEFPLAEAAEAQRLVEGKHVRGKVVLTVD